MPAVLLSFGENGWNDDSRAPRGRGRYGVPEPRAPGLRCRLAAPECSGDDPVPGWRAELETGTLPGRDRRRPLSADDAAPFPHGTAVWRSTRCRPSALMAIRTRARNRRPALPIAGVLRVRPAHPARRRGNAPQGVSRRRRARGTLAGTGVRRVPQPQCAALGFNEPDVNFHGLTVRVRLPEVGTVHGGTWTRHRGHCKTVRISSSCCRLERRRSRPRSSPRCARPHGWRSTARSRPTRDPRPAFDDWKRAREPPVSRSRPRPASSGPGGPTSPTSTTGASRLSSNPSDADALILACRSRASRRTGAVARRRAQRPGAPAAVRVPSTGSQGYAWYDTIPRVIADLRTNVTAGGLTCTARRLPGARARLRASRRRFCRNGPRPSESASFVRAAEAPEAACIDLPADIAFAGEAWSCDRTTPCRW